MGRDHVARVPAEAGHTVVAAEPPPAAPRHVVILGLGPSLEHYVDNVKRLGGRHAFADEVWGINAVGGVLQCDRIFHMDDVRVQEARAAAAPESNIAHMLAWMRRHPGPIMTSQVPEPNDYPGLVAFPLSRSSTRWATPTSTHRRLRRRLRDLPRRQEDQPVRLRLHLSQRPPRREGPGLRRVLARHRRGARHRARHLREEHADGLRRGRAAASTATTPCMSI